MIRKIEAMDGVVGVIIGMSYGGKSLGKGGSAGAIRIQREVSGGLKAVMQSSKGLQEVYIRTEKGMAEGVGGKIAEL